ncbi:MAG: T9SS type A sorting domain-containing protein [Bacteroidota bacterium]
MENDRLAGGNSFHSFVDLGFSAIVGCIVFGLQANAQFAQQGTKLVGTGAVGYALQGQSVSLSSDGNTAISGGDFDNTGIGAAWVWTRSGGVWTQQGGKLVGTGGVYESHQGWSVSLSSDGNTAIVGGYVDNSYAGAAWVWTRSGGVWTQQGGKLVGTGAVGAAQQGWSVSISPDGNTAIIGGYTDNSNAGAAWVWTRSGGVWTQQGSKLVGTGAVGGASHQGTGVSISSDGNTAIVGGNNDNSGVGAAWVWTRSGGVWTQQGNKLVGTGGVEGVISQGWSVSLSSDGNTAIVGAYGDNNAVGAAWVWTRSGGVWTQQGSKLVGTDGVSFPIYQGYSVSISSHGDTALVGGFNDNHGIGAAWVWTRSGGAWAQQGSKLLGTGAVGNAWQGWSVALSSDGKTAIVGGDYDDSYQGAAWIYATPNSPLAVELTSFSATSHRLDVELHWKTATETGNSGFEVDRMTVDNTPWTIVKWKPVGFIKGFGTNASSREYLYSDKQLIAGRYAYRIRQVNQDGTSKYSTVVEVDVGSAPMIFSLNQNYPNPFNPTTTIEFTLPEDGKTELKVYDILGREVATLADGEMKAGHIQQVMFNASRMPGGVYFLQLQFGNRIAVRRLTLLK